MEKLTHDQTKGRHIINVPMPFTVDGLRYIVANMNGWEDDPELVDEYVDAIIENERVDLNPSSGLGEGANIVDIFSFGLMAIAKHWGMPEPDINQLWIHPCRNKITVSIKNIEVEDTDVDVLSHETIMYTALDKNSGKIITAEQASNSCPGNKDDLSRYRENEFAKDCDGVKAFYEGRKNEDAGDQDDDELPF